MNQAGEKPHPALRQATPWDVLVIGGGIVGAGVARDAALRGLATLLVEQQDFAQGTSSRSSRLLHGGIRYLAQGRLGLVREASREKRIVQAIAPHLSEPLAFVFPTYRGTGWPLWQMKVGVKIYDWLCDAGNFGRSSGMAAGETWRLMPSLEREGLTGAVRYYDAYVNDCRLVIDTLRSAQRAGAAVMNYTRFVSARRESGGWSAQLEDVGAQRRFSVRARAVVNAAGPWSEALGTSGVRLRCTKGAHLVFDRQRLGLGSDAFVLTEGTRVLFLIPWGDRAIVGTTDTDYTGRPEDVDVDRADIDYLLGVANERFPGLRLRTEDIIGQWAGLRPLVADSSGRPSDISRTHQISMPEPGWWDVAGGKLTTYRLMAEQTVDRVADHLRLPVAGSATAGTPLLPEGMIGPCSALLPPPVSWAAVRHACEEEWARHLGDIMERRAGWKHYHPESEQMVVQIAQWMADARGWDAARTRFEIARYLGLTVAADVAIA